MFKWRIASTRLLSLLLHFLIAFLCVQVLQWCCVGLSDYHLPCDLIQTHGENILLLQSWFYTLPRMNGDDVSHAYSYVIIIPYSLSLSLHLSFSISPNRATDALKSIMKPRNSALTSLKMKTRTVETGQVGWTSCWPAWDTPSVWGTSGVSLTCATRTEAPYSSSLTSSCWCSLEFQSSSWSYL